MIDHLSIGVRDVARARRFYEQVPERRRGLARLR
jgi:catechol 2,3-dioxygenase-like lactoylglutathione lyase family enzyme